MRRQCHRAPGVLLLRSRRVREKVKIRVQILEPANVCIPVKYVSKQDRLAGEVELQWRAIATRATQIVIPVLQGFNGDQLRSWQSECPEHVQRRGVKTQDMQHEVRAVTYERTVQRESAGYVIAVKEGAEMAHANYRGSAMPRVNRGLRAST